MTHAECEAALVQLARAAEAIFRTFAPDGDQLRICCSGDGYYNVIGYTGDTIEINTAVYPDKYGEE